MGEMDFICFVRCFKAALLDNIQLLYCLQTQLSMQLNICKILKEEFRLLIVEAKSFSMSKRRLQGPGILNLRSLEQREIHEEVHQGYTSYPCPGGVLTKVFSLCFRDRDFLLSSD